MKLAELTPDQIRLLSRFWEAGGVVDFLILECEGSDENALEVSTHHHAVKLAMREIQRRTDEYAERTSKKQQIPKDRIFQITIDIAAEARLVPRKITWLEFLGPRYNVERNGLIVRGKGKFLNEFFFFSDAARTENVIPASGIDYGVGTGFAYAFSSPPYGIGIPAEELRALFDRFLGCVLCGSSESFVFEWPMDWSNYFDAGKDWWGSFLWSLSNPGSNRIVVIAASTTD